MGIDQPSVIITRRRDSRQSLPDRQRHRMQRQRRGVSTPIADEPSEEVRCVRPPDPPNPGRCRYRSG